MRKLVIVVEDEYMGQRYAVEQIQLLDQLRRQVASPAETIWARINFMEARLDRKLERLGKKPEQFTERQG